MLGISETEINMKKAEINLKKGNLIKARDYYLTALAHEPNNITILNNLSEIYALLNEEDKSKGYMEILLSECDKQLMHQKSERIMILKINALIKLGRNDEANDISNEILEINPNNIFANIQKSLHYEINNNPKKAIEHINRLLEIDPNDISSLLSKGRNLYKLEKYDEAIELYNKVFKIDPHNKAAFDLKSQAIKRKKKVLITPHDLAIDCLIYWGRKDFKNATESIEDALKLDSDYDEIWFIQGELYIRTGRINDAINSFKNAFKLNPTSGGVQNHEKFFKLLNKMYKINKFLGFEDE